LSGTSKEKYTAWVYPYLYYFDVRFDNREGVAFKRETVDTKASLMLVPVGATLPKVFQRKYPMDSYKFTNSPVDFYQAPAMAGTKAATLK
jgi:hypothetical protein